MPTRRTADRAMQSRVLIGIPTQSLQAMDGIPEDVPDSWVMSRRYFTALTRAGAVPIMVPLLDDDVDTLRAMYERMDGVFLAGGVDVDPAAYGQARSDACGRTDPARDTVELALTRWAVADGKPLLGVCRGLHILNVALGGTLHQDTALYVPGSIKHDYFPMQGFARDLLSHEVDVASGSRLGDVLGSGAVGVNSMHHQAIRDLGRGLRPTAIAPDGLIEAIEGLNGSFSVAVQWHPEALIDEEPRTVELFLAFVDACARYRRASAGSPAGA
jgi:putative glutamine amidotransferase